MHLAASLPKSVSTLDCTGGGTAALQRTTVITWVGQERDVTALGSNETGLRAAWE